MNKSDELEIVENILSSPKLKELILEAVKETLKREPTEVITTTGHTWKKVGNRWLDVATGLHWDAESRGKLSYNVAMSKYNNDEAKLPTNHEWLEAHGHGIVEVIPNVVEVYHWTSSVYSASPDYAWYFFASEGGSVGVYYVYRDADLAVRCVGR
jgi:hypothetical protein